MDIENRPSNIDLFKAAMAESNSDDIEKMSHDMRYSPKPKESPKKPLRRPRIKDRDSLGPDALFEEECLDFVYCEEWEKLENFALDRLDETGATSAKAFFFLGFALYKMEHYHQSITAYQKSIELVPLDAQTQYNLALAYFKECKYPKTLDHLKLCTQIEPKHPYAYNNLAFIYNMNGYYKQAEIVCDTAELRFP